MSKIAISIYCIAIGLFFIGLIGTVFSVDMPWYALCLIISLGVVMVPLFMTLFDY